jgi:hypothetical protein
VLDYAEFGDVLVAGLSVNGAKKVKKPLDTYYSVIVNYISISHPGDLVLNYISGSLGAESIETRGERT